MKHKTHLRHDKAFDMPALRQRMLEILGKDRELYPFGLESKFPHVFANIVHLWGSPEMEPYFQSLMVADRPGRQGFPADAALEILRLSLAHGTLNPAAEADKYAWASASDQEFKDFLDRRHHGERRQHIEPPLTVTERRVEPRRTEDAARPTASAAEREAFRQSLIAGFVRWIQANDLLKRLPPNELRDAFAVALRQVLHEQEPGDLPPISWD
jgi:hypothetical protein